MSEACILLVNFFLVRIALFGTYTRILPIQIEPIQPIIIDKLDDIITKLVPIGRLHSLTNDSKCSRVGAEVPTAKRYDLFDTSELLEALKLIRDATDLDIKVGRDIGKSKVNMRVSFDVNLISVHVQALAVSIPRTKITDSHGLFGRSGLDDITTAVLNTYSLS